MKPLSSREHHGSRGQALFGKAMVHIVRSEQPNAGMVMLLVVPAEEVSAEATGVLDAAEALRKPRPVFECFELRLREGVVIRDVGSRMRLSDPEVREQEGDG